MTADIYLRQGLTPQPDVELYPSEALSTGGVITGTLAATEAKDAATVSGLLLFTGAFSSIESTQDNASLAGVTASSGTLGATEAQDSATLSSGAALITGTLAATEAQDVAAFEGPASIVITLPGGGIITSRHSTSGTLFAVERQDNATATGIISAVGSLFATEAQDIFIMAASVAVVADLIVTERSDEATASGAVRLGQRQITYDNNFLLAA